MPTEVRPGIAVAMVAGRLVTRDNKHSLKVTITFIGLLLA